MEQCDYLNSYTHLNEIGLKFDTDKASSNMNYLSHYELYTSNIRGYVKRVLEIGIHEGSSLKMWKEWFYNADIHGVDIRDLSLYSNLGSRIKTHCVDSTSTKFGDLCKELKPNIIIDDGGHSMISHQVAFELAFPHLKSGGFYFIEDLGTCYMPMYGGYLGPHGKKPKFEPYPLIGKHGRTVDWLSELSHAVNFGRHLNPNGFFKQWSGEEKWKHIFEKYPYYSDIYEMHFTPYLCLIVKR